MNIVFASSNQGKIKELQHLLLPFDLTIIPQQELGVHDAAETASTFVENALIKARHAAELTGLPAIADDSGLVVPALHGEPGIRSARYAGDNATSTENIKKLLAELSKTNERKAAFHCVLVFLLSAQDPTPLICHGIWQGEIARVQEGVDGFGYDPVFFDLVEQRTAAQLTIERKNQLSHRGKALQQLLQQLPAKLSVK